MPTQAITTLQLHKDYRPDIDGLRAIAVLAVIAFHAFPDVIPGGYIGVDIFFVISGFLISKHIFSDLYADNFSLSKFYLRRIKRIFPALILILFFCTLLGWLVLTPIEYDLFSKTIAGGAGFIANLIFWHDSGYFDTAADTKPLLHLWSLGVEEQFYMLWPLILVWSWRIYSKQQIWLIISLLTASLFYSIWLVSIDISADFYSPLTRFWELAVGALLAHAVLHQPLKLSQFSYTLLSWLGFILIAFSLLCFNKASLFPGALALCPVLGAACVILAGFNNAFLYSRCLVGIGLISYPLYLWHWPLLSYANIMQSGTPSPVARLLLLSASFLLAWLTYRFVELPIRARPNQLSRPLIWSLCSLMLLMCATGLIIQREDGFKFRLLSNLNGDASTLVIGANRQQLPKTCGLEAIQEDQFELCLASGPEEPRIAFIGDSKAEALFFGFANMPNPPMPGILISSVMPPSSDNQQTDPAQLKSQLALNTILNNPSIKMVVLANAVRHLFPVDPENGYIIGETKLIEAQWLKTYSNVIERLQQAGKQVIFVIDNPTLPDPRSCISGGLTSSSWLNQIFHRKPNPRCTIVYSEHIAGTYPYRRFIQQLGQAQQKLLIYDPSPILCDLSQNQCAILRNRKFYYSYSDHISDYASSLIAQDLRPLINKFLPKSS